MPDFTPENPSSKKNPPVSHGEAISFELLWKKAHEAIEKQKYRDALLRLNEILQKFPTLEKHSKSDVLSLSGKLYYWLGDYLAAKQHLNLALQHFSKNNLAHLMLGKIALAEYFFVKARGHFMSIERPNAEADLAMCRLSLKLREVDRAGQFLKAASHGIPPTNPEYRLLSAFVNLLRGETKFSVSEGTHLLTEKVFENDPDGLLMIAELFVTAGDYLRARGVLQNVRAVCPENDQCAALLAQCAFADQDLGQAESLASFALQRNPYNAYAMTVLLKIATKRGEYEQAVNLGKKILTNSPEYPLAHANLGDAYFCMGDYSSSRAEYESADEFSRTETKGSKLRKARLHIIDRHYPEAKEMLESLLNVEGLFYDDALCDLLLVYDFLHEDEKRKNLLERMEMRRAFSPRIEAMLEKVASGKPLHEANI